MLRRFYEFEHLLKLNMAIAKMVTDRIDEFYSQELMNKFRL